MKRFFAGVLVTLAIVLVARSWGAHQKSKAVMEESSELIQEQISNVAKLVVTEGHFSEVYNYKDSKELFGPLVTANKKALVVVNAEVTIAYDLSKLEYELDAERKTLNITFVPEPEITINPDFEYYDVTADYLNPFDASDYNMIKKNAKKSLLRKIEGSAIRANAENRLISELQQFFVITKEMGWSLQYSGPAIQAMDRPMP